MTTAQLEVDMTYGGVYAGTSFDFSQETADHFNSAAARARDVLEGEFVPFSRGDHISIACPMARSWARADFISGYTQLDAVIDGRHTVHLADYPHLFSNDPEDVSRIRATPTYIPTGDLPDGTLGTSRTVEILQDGRSIFGPAERFFHTRTSGSVYNQIENGHGRIVVEIRGDLSVLEERGQVIFFTDPAFGEPTGAVQINDDGSATSLKYRLLGRDHIGDVFLFNEGVVVGVRPRGDRVVLELPLSNRATGLAAALFAGHTRDLAFRIDAKVL